MATTKKKYSGARKKAATTAATKTFGGKKYSQSSCHKTLTEAKKAAEKARAGGKNARVVEKCVFTRTAGR